ncbi:CapA family protein [Streptomyces piniterrae]|uniref:CapA family protein n=1 Tax=Streptomyces piniterrae TaxID=2571125 RepID=A0A4U0NK35_9ACTN|nr:CapA family protein [Streptomyces piniterrae]
MAGVQRIAHQIAGRPRTAAVAALAVLAASCGAQQYDAPPPALSPDGSYAAQAVAAPEFTLLAAGDVLPHREVIEQSRKDAHGRGHDFRAMLAGVKPVVSGADLAICHVGAVYGKEGGPLSGRPPFASPPQLAAALKHTGYDSCSTASDHALDDGTDGVRRTLGAMDAAGLRHAGSARSTAEAGRPTLLKAGPAKVAQLSYTYGTHGTNSTTLPGGQPWAVNLIDRDKIVADARAARKAGADVVVVSVHWGTEWQQAPDGQQRALARALTSARTAGRPDIDLILGTGAHAPQAYEKVNGTWVVYGLGDQLTGRVPTVRGTLDARANESSMARFTFARQPGNDARWAVRRAEFLPQLADPKGGFRVIDLAMALTRDPGRSDYLRARDDIGALVLSRGAADDGLVMAE